MTDNKMYGDEGLLQVNTWHKHSYIAGIHLLAHALSVKLSPCPGNCSRLAEHIAVCHHMWSPTCMWAFQMQFATCSGSPQDECILIYSEAYLVP